MRDISLMEIIQDHKELFNQPFSLLFRESPVRCRLQMSMKRLPRHVLHHQINVLLRINRLNQPHYILVIEPAQNPDFSDRLLFAVHVHQFQPVILFYGDPFPRLLMKCLFNDCVRPFAYFFAEVVGGDVGAAGGGELVGAGGILERGGVAVRLRPQFLGVECLMVVPRWDLVLMGRGWLSLLRILSIE